MKRSILERNIWSEGAMLSYEGFFLIILVSLLGPVVGVFVMIFQSQLEKKIHFLEMKNRQIHLEKELRESEYLQLTQQIEPHFLFNALNSLLGLVRLRKMEQLQPAFESLVQFLRYKYSIKEQLSPLAAELDHTRQYVEIQKLRFGNRLQVRWEIDPDLTQVLIPPYLLQTLVENAFKHGLEQTEEDPVLSIRLRGEENRVWLQVSDNGPGFLADPFAGNAAGIGLQNMKRRLQLLFGENGQLIIGRDQGGQVIAVWPKIRQEEEVL
jgi:sensor histidine kinase YesM